MSLRCKSFIITEPIVSLLIKAKGAHTQIPLCVSAQYTLFIGPAVEASTKSPRRADASRTAKVFTAKVLFDNTLYPVHFVHCKLYTFCSPEIHCEMIHNLYLRVEI